MRGGRTFAPARLQIGPNAQSQAAQTPPFSPSVTPAVNGSTTHQTMAGMGFNVNSGAWDSGNLAPYLTMGVRDCGATRWRVIVEEASSIESSNDDADPANYNWTAYDATFSNTQFSNLWNTIAHLNSLGISDGITLCIMGRSPTFMGQPLTTSTAIKNEWAEMTAALAYYGLVRRNPPVTFGAFAPNNEVDWDQYEGTQMLAATYADCLGRLADRLTALGLSSLKIAGPDCASLFQVENYILEYVGDADVMSRVQYVSGHNYSGDTSGMVDASTTAGVPWGMSELGDWDQAFSAVGDGASFCELWEYSDSVYNHAIRRGDPATPPNDQLPGFPAPISFNGTTYGVRTEFYEWCHLCRFVRPGSVRIGSTNAGNLTILAFKHAATNSITIVGTNSGSAVNAGFTLSNVTAPSKMRLFATGGSDTFTEKTSAPIIGGVAYAAIPANCIFTLTTLGS